MSFSKSSKLFLRSVPYRKPFGGHPFSQFFSQTSIDKGPNGNLQETDLEGILFIEYFLKAVLYIRTHGRWSIHKNSFKGKPFKYLSLEGDLLKDFPPQKILRTFCFHSKPLWQYSFHRRPTENLLLLGDLLSVFSLKSTFFKGLFFIVDFQNTYFLQRIRSAKNSLEFSQILKLTRIQAKKNRTHSILRYRSNKSQYIFHALEWE